MHGEKRVKLFCIPYAGGSATVYHRWKVFAGADVELIPIELAGRGKRIREPFYRTLTDAIDDIYSRILPLIREGSYAFYGHSMGGAMAFALCQKLAWNHEKEPLHLFVSGRCPPSSDKISKVIHNLPLYEFKKEVLNMGGTENGLFENEELLRLFLPILRNDFRLIEEYDANRLGYGDFRTSCNMTAFAGREDDTAAGRDMQGWKNHTNGQLKLYEYEGGHFFLHDHGAEIMRIVSRTLCEAQFTVL